MYNMWQCLRTLFSEAFFFILITLQTQMENQQISCQEAHGYIQRKYCWNGFV